MSEQGVAVYAMKARIKFGMGSIRTNRNSCGAKEFVNAFDAAVYERNLMQRK
jgi:hypothetical protein